MNYATIKTNDIANGVGVRTSLFVSGCRNHCPGCFNKDTWDFNYGECFNLETIKYILDTLKPKYIEGLTILGGEPFEPENQKDVLLLIKKFKEVYPTKSLWIYSGYILDKDILPYNGKVHTIYTDEILKNTDILVDGPFKIDLYKITLNFRGSSNQRIIDIKQTLNSNKIILSELNN